jgi:hypothetical protein
MMRMIRRWLTSRSGTRCSEQAMIIMLLAVPKMVRIKGIEREMG